MGTKIIGSLKACFTAKPEAEASSSVQHDTPSNNTRSKQSGHLANLSSRSGQNRAAQFVAHPAQAPAESTAASSNHHPPLKNLTKGMKGIAKSAERTLIKPLKHRAQDALVPAGKQLGAALTGNVADLSAVPPEGPQLQFKHEGVYGIEVSGPALNVTHNALVIANKMGHVLDKITGQASERNRPEIQGFAQRPQRQFNLRLPHIRVKEGRVKVRATGMGRLSAAERKQQRARAKIVQSSLKQMNGQKCLDVTPHSNSDGFIAEYKQGGLRWVGSQGEHIPFASFDAIKSLTKDELKAPPLSLLSGIYELTHSPDEKQGTAWRLDQGKLYVWNKSTQQPGWQYQAEAHSLTQHADGNVYALAGNTLLRCNPLAMGHEALSPVIHDLAQYQSVQLLPNHSGPQTPLAVAVDHNGKVFQLHSDGQAKQVAHIPGLSKLVPVPDSTLLCGHTSTGDFVALQADRTEEGHAQFTRISHQDAGEHAALTQLTQQIPLDVGHKWVVQSIGYDGKSGEATPPLHAVLASDQGHNISMVYSQNKWTPQYKTDATILQSGHGLISELVETSTRIQYDQNTDLAVNTRGELCIRHQDIGRWEQLRTPEGLPIQGVQKIVTGANELTYGKRVYVLTQNEHGSSIHELNLGGRIKHLPAQSTANELGGASPSAWLSPNRLTASLKPAITTVATGVAPATYGEITEEKDHSKIIDLTADKGGAVYQLSEQGTISKAGKGQGAPITLPSPVINGQTFVPKQISVAGDNGRLFALAEAPTEGATSSPLRLMEFVPTSHAEGSARHAMQGSWVHHDLEWKDAAGKDIPAEARASARLSTSLYGTPVIEVKSNAESQTEAVERYRILQLPVHEAGKESGHAKSVMRAIPKSVRKLFSHLPGKVHKYSEPVGHHYTLQSVSTSREDPRIGMDRNDAIRPKVPGTTRTAIKWTVLGKQYAAINRRLPPGASAARKTLHYGSLPVRAVARHLYQLARLVAQEPPMALVRLKQDLWGRKGLQKDYAAIRDTMKTLPNIQPPLPNTLTRAAPLRPDMLANPGANHTVEAMLQDCLEAVEQMCITAHVLEPDRITESKPGKLRKVAHGLATPLNKTSTHSKNSLPTIKKFWDSIGQDKQHFFTPAEQLAISRIQNGLHLLEKNNIKLWDGRRGALSNFTAYHGSHAIQSASLVASMQNFSDAVQIRTFGQTSTAGADGASGAAFKTIESNQKDTRANQLARCGFSGWHAYEAMVESVTDLRHQINNRGTCLTPGSPLFELVKQDLDLQQAKTMPKDKFVALVANKWAEAVNSLNPRTVFGWSIQKNLGAGTYLASGGNNVAHLALATLSYGGIINAGGSRSSFIGVEAIGSNHNQTEQGPVIVFLTRGISATGSVGANIGIAPAHDKELSKHFGGYANTLLEASHSRSKGGALVLAPEKVHEFARKLFDEKIEPLELMRMGVNQGGIGLNLHQNDGVLRAGIGMTARQDWFDQAPQFGARAPNSWGVDKIGQFSGNFGLRAALGVEIYHKAAMELHLRLGFARGNGFEYQGDSGPKASLSLMGYGFGNAPNIQTGGGDAVIASARAANLGLDVAGIELQASWNSHYKRTADFVKTDPVSNENWQQLLAEARQVTGLKLEVPAGVLPVGIHPNNLSALDVSTTEGRAAMRTLLNTWASKLQDMESAVCTGARIEEIPDPARKARMKALAAEASNLDEHLACKFMLDAESTLLKSHAAELDLPMIQDSARIELNVPRADPTQHDVTSHLKLGSVMEKARQVEAAIPGIKDVKSAYASLKGYNETRLVFEMDPRKVNLANRLMIMGVPRSALSPEQNRQIENEAGSSANAQDNIRLSAAQIMEIMESEPMNYHCVVHCAKNNESNTIGHGIGLGLTLRHEVSATEERFLAETHIKHGWGSRVVRAELMPTAQESLSDTSRGRSAFTRRGVTTLRQTQPRFEAQTRNTAEVFVPAPALREATLNEGAHNTTDQVLSEAASSSALPSRASTDRLTTIPEEPALESKTSNRKGTFLGMRFRQSKNARSSGPTDKQATPTAKSDTETPHTSGLGKLKKTFGMRRPSVATERKPDTNADKPMSGPNASQSR